MIFNMILWSPKDKVKMQGKKRGNKKVKVFTLLHKINNNTLIKHLLTSKSIPGVSNVNISLFIYTV